MVLGANRALRLRKILSDGFVRVSSGSNGYQPWTITYLTSAIYEGLGIGQAQGRRRA